MQNTLSFQALQCGNQLAGFENDEPVQPQDIISLLQYELPKLDSHNPGYAVKIEKLYSVDNMPTEVKQEVLEKYRDINVDYDWWSDVYENWYDKLKNLGFYDVKINFSGFWLQGDGASFTADIDLAMYLKAHKLGNKYRAALLAAKASLMKIEIYRICHQYSHENTISVRGEYYRDNSKLEVQLDKLVEEIKQHARSLSRRIYNDLKEHYSYLTSDDAVFATLNDNDYSFTRTGKIF